MTGTFFFAAVVLLMAATSCEVKSAQPCDPDLIPEARAVLKYLESINDHDVKGQS
jgi:hypothetical protein